MSREQSLYLRDILGACERVLAYTQHLDRAQFEAQVQVQDAVLFNLMV